MAESTRVQGMGAYANLCLTVIAACLIYLCYDTKADRQPSKVESGPTKVESAPTKVKIVGIAPDLSTPLPCKLMFKKKSNESLYSFRPVRTEWTDDGTLAVKLVGGVRPVGRMKVEIVGVASNIRNPLPIKTKKAEGGLFGSTQLNDGAIAVRLVGIEKGVYAKWDAIPARLTEIDWGGASAAWDAIPVKGDFIGYPPVVVRVSP